MPEVPCAQCQKPFYVRPWELTREKPRRFCSDVCRTTASRGRQSPTAKPDEKTLHARGYVLVYMPDHPRAHKGRVMEHIVVAEQKYGRALTPKDHVHHLNRDKTDNRPENLVILTNSQHQREHTEVHQKQRKRVTLTCGECGGSYEIKESRVANDDPRSQSKYCSLACRHRAWGRQMHALRLQKRALKQSQEP